MSQIRNEQEKQEHTPGPWSVHCDWPLVVVPKGHERRSIGASSNEAQDREHYALKIAFAAFNKYSIFAHETTEDQARANARLIAAAPDMLDVLRDLLPYVGSCVDWDDPGSPAEADWRRIQAVIAKATGKTD